MEALLALKARGIPLLVDPKIPHLGCYAGATLITPNHHETETATHRVIRNDEDARLAAADFRDRAKCDAALVTRGEFSAFATSSTSTTASATASLPGNWW